MTAADRTAGLGRPPAHGVPSWPPADGVVPLDPQLAAIVEAMRAAAAPPPFSGTPQQARARMQRAILAARARSPRPEVGAVEDAVASALGLAVPVRIYRPPHARDASQVPDARVAPDAPDASKGPPSPPSLPTVLFCHGGGFVLGSVELMDDIARLLCRELQAVVVSVDYRLAPEQPFPAAHDDALAAAVWVLAQVRALGGDRQRVGVAGESAGANLVASTALELHARGLPIAAQLLVVPGVDLARDVSRLAASGRQHPMLSAADLADIARLYIGHAPGQALQMPASPLRAASLAGAPPAVIAVAGHDPLRDEGLAYAGRLRADGVPVQVLDFPAMFHPFLGFFAESQGARRAAEAACQAFKALLSAPAPMFPCPDPQETP